jgi:hypothetical protein
MLNSSPELPSLSPLSFSPLGKRKVRRSSSGGVQSQEQIDKAWQVFDMINSVNQSSSDTNHPDVMRIIDNWKAKCKSVYGLKQEDANHICTSACENGKIVTIDRSHNLYGCITSGRVHHCQQGTSCRFTRINDDGTRICLMSGVTIGAKMDGNAFAKADKGGDEEKLLSDRESDGEDLNDEEISPVDVDMFSDFCTMDYARIDEGPAEPLDAGKTDSMGLTRRDRTLMRAIIRVSKYEKPLEPRKKHKKFANANQDNLRDRARGILSDIFYNTSVRERLNMEREKKAMKKATKAVYKYYRTCRGQERPAYSHKVDEIWTMVYGKRRTFLLPQYDEELVAKYVDVIMHLWRALLLTPYFAENDSRFNFKQHVLGTLYCMEKPLEIDGMLIFEGDSVLRMYLPHRSDLCELPADSYENRSQKYEKSDITQGVNNIKFCFNQIRIHDFPEIEFELGEIRRRLGI